MKKIVLIVLIGFIISVIVLIVRSKTNLAGIESEQSAYSSAATYSTSSVAGAASEILSRATSSRSYARVCNLGAGQVFVFKQATSTGAVIDAGNPIYSSSTAGGGQCLTLGVNDPYTGALWAISSIATSTVGIEASQR